MAVTTTVQNILTWAYAKSLKNQPTRIATESAELLEQVNRSIQKIYSIAAQKNPTFFGQSSVVSESASQWAVPDDAESVYWIEDSGGAEVIVVPIWDKTADPSKLTVISTGRVLQKPGVNDPSGDLTLYYSRVPTDAASLASTLDSLWREDYNEFLVLEVALYLAVKDGRAEEVPGLITARDRELARFISGLERHYANIRTKFGPAFAISTHATVAPSDLLIQ